MATTTLSGPCLSCGKSSNLRCSQCQIVCFCNQDCQKAVWKSHKSFCRAVANPSLPSGTNDDNTKDTCVILDGMGPCGANEDFSFCAVRDRLLACGVTAIGIDVTKGQSTLAIRQIASLLLHSHKAPQTLVMLSWGSGDNPVEQDFAKSDEFRSAVQKWCRQGGRFLVHGERLRLHNNWPKWFDKPWTDADYYRTDHKCFADGPGATHWCQWYKNARDVVLSGYNVKACMIKNVAPDEVLFGTTGESASYSLVPQMAGSPISAGQVAVAFGRYGEGTVSFFGDVNFEDETLRTMAIIARGG